jgi:hypothetical protein
MRFSKYFGLNQKQAELDFVDIDVSRDTRLFLDPYSIGIKDNEFSSRSADQIKTYFSEVMEALRENDLDHARYLTSNLSEPRETFLGFSKGQPKGRGVGRFQADQLLSAFRGSRAFRSGMLSDLAEAEPFIDGISSDKISDLTTNVIRKSLIEYTQAECSLHGIKLDRAIACAPVWDEVERRWDHGYAPLPIVDGQPVILVPKYFVRWRPSLNSQEFYNHYMIEFLRDDLIAKGSSLVRLFKKSKRPFIAKATVKERHPFVKDHLAKFVRENPQVLEAYKAIQGAKGALGTEELEKDFDERAFAKSLVATLGTIPPGMRTAGRYHKFILGCLTFVFYPELTNPIKEHELNQGRKRVDIKFTNAAEIGFFRRMAENANTRSLSIFIECKNYSSDLGNPEIDQLLARFDLRRGKIGFILCRMLVNEQLMLDRCRDAAKSDQGFVIVLTDDKVQKILYLVAEGKRENISNYLFARFSELTD